MISMSSRSTTLTSYLVATVIALAGCASKEAPEEATGEPVLIQQRWWNWAAAEETATNPVADRSGADCARNQPDDLWFFAGSFGGAVRRTCSVPAGRPIVAPVVNLVAPDRAECVTFLHAASGSAKLDGKPLTVERMDAEKITYRGVDGNPVTDTSDEYAGTACGLWITIPDPAPGAHTLAIRGKSGSFAVGADYTFKVAA